MGRLGSIVNYDIKKTGDMLNGYNDYMRFTTYDKIFFETNDACDKIISNYDVNDKSILTVLSSGDQAFEFYKNGAKNVDLFDVNKLTIYYYYLRIWHMRKYGTMYPEWCFDNKYIKNLLMSVKPNSEDELMAYKYWSKYISKFDSDTLRYLFHCPYSRGIHGDVDIPKLLQNIDDDDFSFYNIDISLPINLHKKYDFIYTSNLSDYIKEDRLKVYRDNLYNHLNKGGIVLSSNLSNSFCYGADYYQRKTMKKCFKHKQIHDYNEDTLEIDDIGYSYKKRNIKRII